MSNNRELEDFRCGIAAGLFIAFLLWASLTLFFAPVSAKDYLYNPQNYDVEEVFSEQGEHIGYNVKHKTKGIL